MKKVKEELGLLRRSRMDIAASILGVAVEGAKKTHIMYRCNLGFRQLQAYLDFLLDRGLLMGLGSRSGKNSNLFKASVKGRAFLRAYRDLKALLTT